MGRSRAVARCAFAGAVLAGVALGPSYPAAVAAPPPSPGAGVLAADAHFESLCVPVDPALEELSGLAVVNGRMYAVGDSGTDDTVVVLDGNCAVAGTIPVPVDPYDIEDLAVGPDGRLWLSDTGDNARIRSTVALIGLDPASGTGQVHRLTYPDGPHDAESLLIQRDGVPLVVTKDVLAASGIYRPVGGRVVDGLSTPGPTPLERVGEVRLGPTSTPGGPVPIGGSTLVTGGAVSADGTVAALRTYTDVYLFAAPDGDLVRALTTTTPVRVALPNQPQGEAIAFTPDGDLLAGSESAAGPLPAVQILRGAVDRARGDSAAEAVASSSDTDDVTASDGDGPRWSTPALLAGALVAGLATYGLARRRSRSPRR